MGGCIHQSPSINQQIKIMEELSLEEKKKYRSAISKGFVHTDVNGYWHTFCGTWVKKHPNRISTLTRLQNLLGHEPKWEDLTDDVLSDLKDSMRDSMAPNSVKTICAELKAVINRNVATKPIKSASYPKILSSSKVPSTSVFLTDEELEVLHGYKPKSDTEQYVKKIFMLECLTGARNIDCRKLSLSNIVDVGGTKMLYYVPRKHPVDVYVPVHKWLTSYLETESSTKHPIMSIGAFNNVLKNMCLRCGINERVKVYQAGGNQEGPKWMFVTSHVGRRTFATLLFLKGASIEDIAMLMGHMNGNTPNIAMTERYILCRRQISKNVFKLFE